MADTDYYGKDKWMHFGACALIGFLEVINCILCSVMPLKAFLLGVGVVMVVGGLKEDFDSVKDLDHFCIWDLVADIIGGLVGSGLGMLAVLL